MASEVRQSREIDGKGKTVRELLAGRKYSIDYYQREYKWQTKQVAELIDDLVAKFSESYDEGHERTAVAEYGHYFVGSIIVSDKDGQKFIIDGQQRLTTRTLLLIWLQHQLDDADQKSQLADLIFSSQFGKRSFNLDIPERTPCMDAIYADREFPTTDLTESVANIVGRYSDIGDAFPDDLRGEALPYFVDWLIECVHLVEITAYSDSDAYRHGRPGPRRVADGIKSWLRSQYARTIRERKRGAAPEDFDLIGTEFHRWVRDHEERLGLTKSGGFVRFIDRDFAFYAHWYERLRRAGDALTPGLERVHFNAEHNFTLQYPVLLAPLRVDDAQETILNKVRATAAYLDILIHRRIWNWHAIDYSTMQYAMFLVMRDIRGKGVEELATLLLKRLDNEDETFRTHEGFRLHGMNGRQIHRLLARMTDYVETGSGLPSRYAEYAKRGGKDGMEIEHIWANHPERHEDEFPHPSEFSEYRNRIGDLLLLPKSFNASYSDLSYEEKLAHYDSQSLLARSLHPNAYDHNPGFARFIETSGLPFKPHPEFRKADLDDRQELYIQLASQIWSPDRVELDAGLTPSSQTEGVADAV